MSRAGWFRVKHGGDVVRATEDGGRVRIHGEPNDYPADAFEWLGSRYDDAWTGSHFAFDPRNADFVYLPKSSHRGES